MAWRLILDIKKPDFPIIILYADDWNLHPEVEDVTSHFDISHGWIAGFLIEEKEDSYIIAAEYFDTEGSVRYTQAIPKKCINFKHIFKEW